MFCLIIKSPLRNTKILNNFTALLNYFFTSLTHGLLNKIKVIFVMSPCNSKAK